jgi:ketosteroid isomerase-like protein
VTDTELRELCHAWLDAIERHDVERVAEIYAPEFSFWVNLTGSESSREQNLETLRAGHALHRRRTYDDRRIDTFATGFLAQYSVNVVTHSGKRASLSACVVAQCKDGRITHVDEYLDSSKFRPPKERNGD